ncbi:MAG: hypothetical protein GWP19_07940 [Planctomycetia bacterium]|nr:hypothetical protein [Planctomycetia bacterium]
MTKKIKYIIALITILSIGFGQLKSDLSQNNAISQGLSGSGGSIMSLFDPSRFSMNHSFSMSMMSVGKQSIGVASYTNNMNFLLRDNLRLQTYMTFMQPQMLSANTQNPYSNSQLYFNTVLDYSPTENTHFQVSFGNYPRYSRYQTSPFQLNRGY